MRTVALVTFFILAVFVLAFSHYLRRFRIDIHESQWFFEGRSYYPAVNILNPKNYDARGQELLRIVYFALGAQTLAGVVWVFW